MKKTKTYDLAHRVMRVQAGDYAIISEVSEKAGISMAEALHLLLQARGEGPHVGIPAAGGR